MSNITVRDNNRVTVVNPKVPSNTQSNHQEIIDADFIEISESTKTPKSPQVHANPKNSSGNSTPKFTNQEYQYDGGKIIQNWFVGVIERIVDKFMK